MGTFLLIHFLRTFFSSFMRTFLRPFFNFFRLKTLLQSSIFSQFLTPTCHFLHGYIYQMYANTNLPHRSDSVRTEWWKVNFDISPVERISITFFKNTFLTLKITEIHENAHFLYKKCIKPPYTKLHPLKSALIIFLRNNGDPCKCHRSFHCFFRPCKQSSPWAS